MYFFRINRFHLSLIFSVIERLSEEIRQKGRRGKKSREKRPITCTAMETITKVTAQVIYHKKRKTKGGTRKSQLGIIPVMLI